MVSITKKRIIRHLKKTLSGLGLVLLFNVKPVSASASAGNCIKTKSSKNELNRIVPKRNSSTKSFKGFQKSKQVVEIVISKEIDPTENAENDLEMIHFLEDFILQKQIQKQQLAQDQNQGQGQEKGQDQEKVRIEVGEKSLEKSFITLENWVEPLTDLSLEQLNSILEIRGGLDAFSALANIFTVGGLGKKLVDVIFSEQKENDKKKKDHNSIGFGGFTIGGTNIIGIIATLFLLFRNKEQLEKIPYEIEKTFETIEARKKRLKEELKQKEKEEWQLFYKNWMEFFTSIFTFFLSNPKFVAPFLLLLVSYLGPTNVWDFFFSKDK